MQNKSGSLSVIFGVNSCHIICTNYSLFFVTHDFKKNMKLVHTTSATEVFDILALYKSDYYYFFGPTSTKPQAWKLRESIMLLLLWIVGNWFLRNYHYLALLRLPDICRKGLCSFFASHTVIFQDGPAVPHEMYISGSVLGLAHKNLLRHLVHPCLIFMGSKSAKFCLNFWPRSRLKYSGFRNGATCRKWKTCFRSMQAPSLVHYVVKVENNWRDVGRPSGCSVSQLPLIVVVYSVDAFSGKMTTQHLMANALLW